MSICQACCKVFCAECFMDATLSESHNDKLIEITTLIRSNKRALGSLISESSSIITKIDKYQNKREVSRELRRRYIDAIES